MMTTTEIPTTHPLNLIRVSDVPRGRIRWLWDRRVPRAALTLISGHPGDGKSFLVACLVAMVHGETSVMCCTDETPKSVSARLRVARGDEVNGEEVLFFFPGYLDGDEARENFVTLIRETRPALIALDPWSECFRKTGYEGLRWIRDLARAADAAVVATENHRKNHRRGRVRVDSAAVADSVMTIERRNDGVLCLRHVKSRYSPAMPELRFRAEPAGEAAVLAWEP